MAVDSRVKSEEDFPCWTSVPRRFGPDSSFFAPGNIERELLAKQVLFSLYRLCTFEIVLMMFVVLFL